MAGVFNWQLGRPMDYPHEERHPKWQFAFVFNPNRCIGCQTCTMACKSTWTFSKGQELMWWNNVESKPYGGYPQHWDAKLLGMLEEANPGGQVWNTTEKEPSQKPYGTFQGKTIFEAAEKNVSPEGAQKALGYLPTDDEWRHPNIHEDTPAGDLFQKDGQYGGSTTLPEHKVWFFHLARICNHCTYPGCLASCPRNAIYKRPEDGIVLIDQSRCRGYRKCVEGCPYKKGDVQTHYGYERKMHRLLPTYRRERRDGQPHRRSGRNAVHGRLRRQNSPARPGENRRPRAVGQRPAKPAVLLDPRAAGRPSALSAVRHRA